MALQLKEIFASLLNKPQFHAITADIIFHTYFSRTLSTVLVYDAFHDVIELATSNPLAQQVVDSWAAGAWFTSRPELPAEITVTVFKVKGETNTDDLSPATHATESCGS